MTRDEAIEALGSTSSHKRFNAAHTLSQIADPRDLPVLQQAKVNERDAYVSKRLQAAIFACSNAASQQTVTKLDSFTEKIDKDVIARIRAQAVEWVAGMLLHEIGSKLGLIALSSSLEIQDYDKSKTKRHVKNLQSIFDAIAQLRSAANLAQYEKFDLSELIDETIAIEREGCNLDISIVGIRPALIYSSRHLIRLALCNGIRNAIESINNSPRKNDNGDSPLIVTWGSSDQSHWISVIDKGPGPSAPSKSSFELGKSTKNGHHGFGLAIAKQAVENLGGEVTLTPSGGGGAKFEMRWKKTNENIDY